MKKMAGLVAAVVLAGVVGCGQGARFKAEMVPVCADGSKTCSDPQLVPDCGGADPCDDPIKGKDVYCC
ncbi:MAG TPA: hypothetical protein VE153_15970 [Myxococcus sp.]|jgi:hypothetical protein|nr:hypothetical protein [Myxococcus sp.]